MSDYTGHQFDTDTVPSPYRQAQLSSNAHWIFGSIYAGLALVGFGFGVWAGAAKPRPIETADREHLNERSIRYASIFVMANREA